MLSRELFESISKVIFKLQPLTKLYFDSTNLTPQDADFFFGIEKLHFYESLIDTTLVQALLGKTNSIKELEIHVGILDQKVEEAFEACKSLYKLILRENTRVRHLLKI